MFVCKNNVRTQHEPDFTLTMRHLEPRCQTPGLHLGAGAAWGACTEVQVQDGAEQGPAPSVQGAARCKRPAPRCMHRTVAGRPSV